MLTQHLRDFARAMWGDWLARMSEPASVPAAALALWLSSDAAKTAFVLTAFACLWVTAYRVWRPEHVAREALEARLTPHLEITYDSSIRRCNDTVNFGDGSRSKCFRIQVQNVSEAPIYNCDGWLKNVDKMPQLSPIRLFWIGAPLSTNTGDLPPKVPRYLQVFRVTEDGQIIVATELEAWPLGEDNKFHPGEYLFDLVIDGHEAGQVDCRLKVIWTGDWHTTEVLHVR